MFINPYSNSRVFYTPIKYNIFNIVLWAVESNSGYIYKYCNTKKDAEKYCNDLNKK